MEFHERNRQIGILKQIGNDLDILSHYCSKQDSQEVIEEIARLEYDGNRQIDILFIDDIMSNQGAIVNDMYRPYDLENRKTIQRLYRIADENIRLVKMAPFYRTQRLMFYKCLLHQEFISDQGSKYLLDETRLNSPYYQDKFCYVKRK